MKTILFMGDSITDVGRNTNNGSQLSIGQGYPLLVTGRLAVKYPGQFNFVNTGVSGNRVVNIYARIKADVWNYAPDVHSILIGVNDVWHELNGNGVENDRYDAVYRMYISDTLKRFPNMKIIIMEPFVLHGSATDEHWDMFEPEVALRAATAKKIAADFGLSFLPLQKMFDDACKICPASYWLADGVHPTPAGHQLIADSWLALFEKEIVKEL